MRTGTSGTRPGVSAVVAALAAAAQAATAVQVGASGTSCATVSPGCALDPLTGQPQPYVRLFDNGTLVRNVSINGVPLTQLTVQHPHTPVFLPAGPKVISVAAGSVSTDHCVRDGG